MKIWSSSFESELTSVLKDWLKHKGKTQKDLKKSLQAESDRMPIILEVLKQDFVSGGLGKLCTRLCEIEEDWDETKKTTTSNSNISDPFGQLDLLLEELKDNCNS